MNVLILGATGSIGAAVAEELLSHGHSLRALARSDAAEQRLRLTGATVVRGDLREPAEWAHAVRDVEAVIQVAATFSDDEGAVDRGVLKALIAEGAGLARPVRVLYTGGCWQYGETGDDVADEDTPFDPIPAFAWWSGNAELLANADHFDTCIIHPAMVYERDGGVLSRFAESARAGGPIEVWGTAEVRWPVVHRADLAVAYRLVLEHGLPGEIYNVSAEEGVWVRDIVAAMAHRFGVTAEPHIRPIPEVIAEQGDWAAGPAIDQQMSSDKIRTQLGWVPRKTDIISEIG